MRIHLLAVGQKMPSWVDQACTDFVRRLSPELRLDVTEIPLLKRGRNPDITRIVRDESRKLLAAVPSGCRLVVLDVKGSRITTEKFSDMLGEWMQQGQDVAIVIGGPDGVSEELLQQAHTKLSLSDMTFPHTLVRIMFVEQLYRAMSILNNHPYHRA